LSKLIVFDVDGTILNSMAMFDKAAIEFSKIKNLPETNVKAIHVGYSNPDAFDFGWGVSKERQFELLVEFTKHFDKVHSENVPDLYEGVKEGLNKLRDMGHVLAIATSKPGFLLEKVLEKHDIKNMFSSVRTWDDVEKNNLKPKPAADMLQSVIDEMGFIPTDVVMVGDTNLDILMGKSAGARTIAVSWGAESASALAKVSPDYMLETNFSDILPLFEKEFTL